MPVCFIWKTDMIDTAPERDVCIRPVNTVEKAAAEKTVQKE